MVYGPGHRKYTSLFWSSGEYFSTSVTNSTGIRIFPRRGVILLDDCDKTPVIDTNDMKNPPVQPTLDQQQFITYFRIFRTFREHLEPIIKLTEWPLLATGPVDCNRTPRYPAKHTVHAERQAGNELGTVIMSESIAWCIMWRCDCKRHSQISVAQHLFTLHHRSIELKANQNYSRPCIW